MFWFRRRAKGVTAGEQIAASLAALQGTLEELFGARFRAATEGNDDDELDDEEEEDEKLARRDGGGGGGGGGRRGGGVRERVVLVGVVPPTIGDVGIALSPELMDPSARRPDAANASLARRAAVVRDYNAALHALCARARATAVPCSFVDLGTEVVAVESV